jgi:hypothetical protein
MARNRSWVVGRWVGRRRRSVSTCQPRRRHQQESNIHEFSSLRERLGSGPWPQWQGLPSAESPMACAFQVDRANQHSLPRWNGLWFG